MAYRNDKEINCVHDWIPAEPILLSDLAKMIHKLQRKYGVRAELRLDGGYGEVEGYIIPNKKIPAGGFNREKRRQKEKANRG